MRAAPRTASITAMIQPSPAPWKMRYAPHIGFPTTADPLLLHTAGSADPVDQIQLIADLGFAGVEDNQLKRRPPDEQARIGEALARRGLEMGSFTHNHLSARTPLWTSDAADDRAAMRAETLESIEAARRVGGRFLTLTSARDPARPHQAQLERFIDNVRWAADLTDAANLGLSIEPVSAVRVPNMLLDHLSLADQVVRAVDRPSVRLLLDLFHVHAADGDLIANIDRVWDRVGIIQAADWPERVELGRGELDWPSILRHIRGKGYAGLVELELACSNPTARGETEMLDLLRDIDAAI